MEIQNSIPNQDTHGKRAIVTTHSGINIDLRNPSMDGVTIADLAHTLSHICRWNGIPDDYFSVAEHCLMAAERAPKKYKLAVLMHDCEEAILGDNITPLKNLIPELVPIGNQLRDLILQKFGIPYNHDAVKKYDNQQLRWERRNIIDSAKYKGMTPKKAKRMFIAKYKEYSKL